MTLMMPRRVKLEGDDGSTRFDSSVDPVTPDSRPCIAFLPASSN
jgi:hypothetical protein